MNDQVKKLKKQISVLLQVNGVKVDSFVDSSSDDMFVEKPMELNIEVTSEDRDKWDYFVRRVNKLVDDDIKVLEGIWSDGLYKIVFDGNDNEFERDLLLSSLSQCLLGIKRQFYKVSPLLPKFSVLVKPTHRCNLDCQYCYDKPYRDSIKEDMSMHTLNKVCQLLAGYASEIQFIFHGGEPTVVGKDWYHKAYKEVFVRYPMVDWDFKMMTNGVAVAKDPTWLDLFERYDIDPGLSFNCLYQEELRTMSQDNPNLEADIQLAQELEDVLLKSQDGKCSMGVIDVISKTNYKDQIKIYKWYRDNKISPCLNHVFHTENTEKNDLEMSAKDYVEEFLKYFEYWLWDKNGMTERSAEAILSVVAGKPKVTCRLTDCRYQWLGFNPIGEIYPCDRHFPDRYKCGTIFEYNDLVDAFCSDGYIHYVEEIQQRLDNKCKECGYLPYCNGGCNGSAIASKGTATDQEDFFCEMFKRQFDGVYDILRDIDLVEDIDKLNPSAAETLLSASFYSMREVYKVIQEKGKVIQLDYDKKNLLECSEYKVFRGINPLERYREQYPGRHLDFMRSEDMEYKVKNLESRRDDLLAYLQEVVKDVTKPQRRC